MNPLVFRKWFRPDEEARERRSEKLKDALTCVQTSTWTYFKDRVRTKARASLYRSGMTNEQAASALITQTVYNEVLEEMEQLERAISKKVTSG